MALLYVFIVELIRGGRSTIRDDFYNIVSIFPAAKLTLGIIV